MQKRCHPLFICIRRKFQSKEIFRHICSDSKDFNVSGTLLEARNAADLKNAAGKWLEVRHSFSQEAVEAFTQYAGDNNPIHLDSTYAISGGIRHFKGCVVHGLLVAGLFSTLFGRTFPGALYVSQNLKFEKPVHVEDVLKARVQVIRSRSISKGQEFLLQCETVITNETDSNTAISGDALVLIPVYVTQHKDS